MGREIEVIKVPRTDKIVDKPINFAPLQNLHLDLMEVKKKLKKGLPVVIVSKAPVIKPPAPIPKPEVTPPPKPQEESENVGEEQPQQEEIEIEMVEDGTPNEEETWEETIEVEVPEEEKNMLKELGEEEQTEQEQPAEEESTPQEENTETDDNVPELSPEEKDVQEREEYIWRFRILKKQYKDRDIPTFNEFDDLTQMKTTYNRTIKEISLENNVDSYRTYLISSFMIMEYSFTNFLGADITGFTGQQMAIMDKYDVMLIELGERSYTRWGSNMPIEIRLLGFVMFQAGIFYIGKMLSEKAGTNIAHLFRGLTGQTGTIPPANQDAGQNPPRKKMRGPSIRVADIKKDE